MKRSRPLEFLQNSAFHQVQVQRELDMIEPKIDDETDIQAKEPTQGPPGYAS
ncbi:MAG: hypothetical protein ABSG19_00715 [Candidatus Aminicenantales bacterium]